MPKSQRAGVTAGPLLFFGVFSMAAVAIGVRVAIASGAPSSEWTGNLVAWAVGALLAGGLARWSGPTLRLSFLLAAPLVLGLSLLVAGLDGVHRWVQLGPLRMNVAEVFLPSAVIAIAALRPPRALVGPAFGAVILALLVAQPDASQATALGGALVLLVAEAPLRRVWRSGALMLIVLAVAGSWLRHDPLAPVPVVEGIMELARLQSPFMAGAAWIALGGAVLAPLWVSRAAGLPLAAYSGLSALAPLAGAFPVPLVGMGMSPILGLWLGMGLLAGLKGSEP
jgi:cell division protein FtsW (lipid II flippase)